MYQKLSTQKSSPSPRSKSGTKELKPSGGYGSLSEVVQRARLQPSHVGKEELHQLDSAVGTRATGEILARGKNPMMEFKGLSTQLWGNTTVGGVPIQAKLTIGAVGDKSEQEADRVAASVVQQINRPAMVSSAPGEMVQGKESQQDEELKMKPRVQGVSAIGEGEASTELSGAINRARGKGKPLDPSLQGKMGEAMSADFSGVKVHTNAQSDRLNQSIQAKAFTVGSDVFFRRGEYNPGSKGGQELLAHELTHVVQQTGRGKYGGKEKINRWVKKTEELDEKSPYLTKNLQPVVGHGAVAPGILQGLNKYNKTEVEVPSETTVTFWSPPGTSLKHRTVLVLAQMGPAWMHKYYLARGLKMSVHGEGETIPNYVTTGPKSDEDWSDVEEYGDPELWDDNPPESVLRHGMVSTLEYYLTQMKGSNIHWLACRDVDQESVQETFKHSWRKVYGDNNWKNPPESGVETPASEYDIFKGIEKTWYDMLLSSLQSSQNYDKVEKEALSVLSEEPSLKEELEDAKRTSVEESYAQYDQYFYTGPTSPSFPDTRWYDYGPYQDPEVVRRLEMTREVLKIVWHAYDQLAALDMLWKNDPGVDRSSYKQVSQAVCADAGLSGYVLSLVRGMIHPTSSWSESQGGRGVYLYGTKRRPQGVSVDSLWDTHKSRKHGSIETERVAFYEENVLKLIRDSIRNSMTIGVGSENPNYLEPYENYLANHPYPSW